MALKVTSIAQVFDGWCSNMQPIKPWTQEMIDEDPEMRGIGYEPKHLEEQRLKFWKPIIERYTFMLRVVVPKNIPPRHSAFSWIRGMGVNKFDEIFDVRKEMLLPNSWMLAFPERHCTIKEQAGLIHMLCKRNEAMQRPMKSLDIITQSPLIISDSMSQVVSIISMKEDDPDKYYDQDYQ